MAVLKFNTEQEWLNTRHKYINASDMHPFYGITEDRTPLTLYYEKIQSIPKPQTFCLLFAMGHAAEPVIAKGYFEEAGYRLRKVNGYFTKGYLGATPDYIHPKVTDKLMASNETDYITEEDGEGLVEMKTANSFSFKEHYIQGEPPAKFQAQLQHQLYCAEKYKWGMILTLVNNSELDVAIYRVNPKQLESHLKKCKYIYDCIQTRTPPETTWSKKDYDILKKLYPVSEYNEKDMGDNLELMGHAADLITHRIAARQHKKKSDDTRNKIKQMIQGYTDVACDPFIIKQTKNNQIRVTETVYE